MHESRTTAEVGQVCMKKCFPNIIIEIRHAEKRTKQNPLQTATEACGVMLTEGVRKG